MDAPLKELAKLEKLATAKGKGPSIPSTLDSLLQSLRDAKEKVQAGNLSAEQFVTLVQTVEVKKKEIDERQKEVYSAISRYGKALDKVCGGLVTDSAGANLVICHKRFPTPLPSYSDLFTSEESIAALERTIALHFLRTGQFEAAETFLEVGASQNLVTILANRLHTGI